MLTDTVAQNEPQCGCGRPRKKVYLAFAEKYIYSKWCEGCEVKANVEADKAKKAESREIIRRAIVREIDPIYYKASLKDFPEPMQQYITSKPASKGLMIWGRVGTGKTHMAAALVKHAIVTGNRVKSIRFKDMILEIRASFDNQHTEEAIYRKFSNCDLLCIDDIGTFRSKKVESDFTRDCLLQVIDKRMRRKLPTIITTNLSPEDVWGAFGERLASRFATFMIIKLEGKDKRLSK